MGETPDITTADLSIAIADAITKDLAQSNFSDINTSLTRAINGVTSELMNRFKDNGIIGVQYGEEGEEKGVGVNYERWQDAMRQVFEGFSKLNFSSIQAEFDNVRKSLESTLDNFVRSERQATDEIDKCNKKIKENAQILATEFRSRKSLTEHLNKTNKSINETSSKLSDLISRRDAIKKELNEKKPAYKEAEAKYKDDYYKSRKEVEKAFEKVKSLDNLGSTDPKWKKAYAEYEKKQEKLWQNPYLDIKNDYDSLRDKLVPLDTEIKEASASLVSMKESAENYEKQIQQLDSLTKEEKQNRAEHIKAIKAENEELKRVKKDLETFKEEVKGKQVIARNNLSDDSNYVPIFNIIKGSLLPLTNRIFGVAEKSIDYDKIEHDAERVADNAEGKNNRQIINELNTDLSTGFNTDAQSYIVISLLEQIRDSLNKAGLPKQPKDIIPKQTKESLKEAYDIIQKNLKQPNQAMLPPGGNKDVLMLPPPARLQRSTVETSVDNPAKRILNSVAANAEKLLAITSEEQDQINADRIKYFGQNSGRFPAENGDKIRFARSMEMWRGKDVFSKMFENFKVTPGVKIDTTEITAAITKVLSGPQMFKAQSGGWKNNMAIAMTGGLASRFQPSLEKSRAQIDVLNTAMAGIRENINAVLQDILDKESKLSGMEKQGDIRFNDDGSILYAKTGESKMVAAQLEESKLVLQDLLADAARMDQVVEQTGGEVSEIIKKMGFASPLLRKYNSMLANVNAGLDKTGKAFKFQRRDQEIMNYSFQLMGRHIGQIFKRLMLLVNPFNLIKKAFSDFASYDVKWQRTMNVIKYNIRRIIRPFMEWLAQQLVNIIGLGNALVKGIGKVFGYDWDLFDQTAADTEKMREELEAAANVSAGFDELHDIGSDNSGANDLLGDIYTPQWEGLNEFFENIGTAIGGIAKFLSKLDFWGWLAIGGAALAGFLILRTILKWFSTGKNPLQSVADGFKTLEKAVGWALLIWAFTEFTKALTDFVDCMKDADWEDIVKSLLMLAGAFAALYLVAGGLMYLSTVLGIAAQALLGIGAIAGGFALLVASLAYFIDTTKDLTDNQLVESMKALASGLMIVVVAIGLLALVFAALGPTFAPAITAFAAIVAVIALVILAIAVLVRALDGAGDDIKLICEGIAAIIQTVGDFIIDVFSTIGDFIIDLFSTVGDFILDTISFIGEVIERIINAIANGITKVIQTVGDIIINIINTIVDAIPKLLNAILNFCAQIGPAIENSVNAILRSVTKLINFIVSGIEYLVNTLLIGSINKAVSTVTFGTVNNLISTISIPRFVPQYEQGTNYVPNNGLAYLHQGEAVVPKKYNQPYNQGMSNEERAFMQRMMVTMNSLDATMKQGINVNGQFVQRGSDLVAVVNKTKSQTGSDLLSNVSYAR